MKGKISIPSCQSVDLSSQDHLSLDIQEVIGSDSYTTAHLLYFKLYSFVSSLCIWAKPSRSKLKQHINKMYPERAKNLNGNCNRRRNRSKKTPILSQCWSP